MRGLGWVVRIGLAAILLAASGLAIRIGVADHYAGLGTTEGLARAVELEPGNADYHRWLGITVLARDPARSKREFEEAVRLNPWDSDSRMRLAILAEAEGRLDAAERELLGARKFNNMFLPRWALTNFYFRRGRTEDFWRWAKLSAEMSFGDRSPLFELAAAAGETNISERLGLKGGELWREYLGWAIGKGRAAEIRKAAVQVAAGRGKTAGGGRIVASACDRLLDLNAVDEALEVWNAGVKSGSIDGGEAGRGRTTNPEFRWTPGGQGFDWWENKPNGGYIVKLGAGGGLRIHFNGDQCEQCPVLNQRVAVVPGRAYTVRVKYRTQEFGRRSGLRWVVGAANGELAGMADDLWAEDGGTGELRFRAGEGAWVNLGLWHQRPQGQTRGEGTLLLESVEIQ